MLLSTSCLEISISAIYRVSLFDREEMGKKTIVTWSSMINKRCYDKRARLKSSLFQSIVIYNFAIVIVNNGIIIPLCLTSLFKVDNAFHCWDQCRCILNCEDPFRYLKIIVCLCVSRKAKDLFWSLSETLPLLENEYSIQYKRQWVSKNLYSVCSKICTKIIISG